MSDGENGGPVPARFATPTEFCAAYDVPANLLPWVYRRTSPVAAGCALAETLAAFPPTKTTFIADDVKKSSGLLDSVQSAGKIPRALFLLHGAWPVPGRTRPQRYANPNYVHIGVPDALPRVTDPDERADWLEQYAALGVAPPRAVCAHLGLAVDAETTRDDAFAKVCRLGDAVGVRYEARCETGLTRLGRVFAITLDWTDVAVPDLARAFAVGCSTVRRLVERAIDAGFEVPADPSVRGGGGFAFSPGEGGR